MRKKSIRSIRGNLPGEGFQIILHLRHNSNGNGKILKQILRKNSKLNLLNRYKYVKIQNDSYENVTKSKAKPKQQQKKPITREHVSPIRIHFQLDDSGTYYR